jgi:diacylglycerol kinase family enzyme
VDGRHFLYTAGVGFSADMTATADAAPAQKARLGQLHFATAAASELLGRYTREQQPRIRVEAGGRTAEGITVMVQNAHALTYFGPKAVKVCEAAGLQTGAVSLTVLRRGRPRDVLGVALRLVTGRDVTRHPEVEAFGGLREAVVTSADGRPLALEADGEFLGRRHRIEFGVDPAALRVLA